MLIVVYKKSHLYKPNLIKSHDFYKDKIDISISKEVVKQCLISKQREVYEAVIVPRPIDYEENGNYVIVGEDIWVNLIYALSASAAGFW